MLIILSIIIIISHLSECRSCLYSVQHSNNVQFVMGDQIVEAVPATGFLTVNKDDDACFGGMGSPFGKYQSPITYT